ncbi:MAG: hypothetical protein ACUVV6_09000, partial [Thermoplasmatota archaeon]
AGRGEAVEMAGAAGRREAPEEPRTPAGLAAAHPSAVQAPMEARAPPGPALELLAPPLTAAGPERELAWAAIATAQRGVEALRSRGILPRAPEELLRDATALFKSGDWARARELALRSDAQSRDTSQLYEKAVKTLEAVRREHEAIASVGNVPPDKADAAERARRAFDVGDYGAAVELGEMVLSAMGAEAIPPPLAPPPVQPLQAPDASGIRRDGEPRGIGPAQRHLCPACNRVFQATFSEEVESVTCPWCGATVRVRQSG